MRPGLVSWRGLRQDGPVVTHPLNAGNAMARGSAEMRAVLSPGLAEAPVLDVLCSHFVLTLTLRQSFLPSYQLRTSVLRSLQSVACEL